MILRATLTGDCSDADGEDAFSMQLKLDENAKKAVI